MCKHTAKEILAQTVVTIEGAYAPSTIRSYKTNFERFIQFCEDSEASPLPAESQGNRPLEPK
jgi:hypothetical protein